MGRDGRKTIGPMQDAESERERVREIERERERETERVIEGKNRAVEYKLSCFVENMMKISFA